MAFADIITEKARQLRDRGFLAEARELLENVVVENPGYRAAASLLGQVCGLMGDHTAAVALFESAVTYDEDNLELLFLLGVEHQNMGQFKQALTCFEKIRQLEPELPLPLRWMGLVLSELGKSDEALACYQEALRLDPDYEEAQIGLATLYIKQFRMEEAEILLEKVRTAHPDNSSALNELSRIYRLQGQVQKALATLRAALRIDPKNRMIASNILYNLCNLDDTTAESVAREHIQIADRFYPPTPATKQYALTPESSSTGRPVHIGYLSGDFCTHSVAAFIEPVLMHHNTRHFSIYCYSNTQRPDETTERLKGYHVTWRNIYGQQADTVVSAMRADGIDILVELSGHTAGNRLDICALKPARIMVSWLGYPHSSGLSQIDYFLTDAACDPPGMTEHLYREQLWRLPGSFCCYLPPVSFPAVAPAPCHSAGVMTFGCFNNFSKVTESMIAVWAEILRRVAGSRLCLKSLALGGAALQTSIRKKFISAGITADRLLFQDYTESQFQHMALYGKVDIALDTYPYHGTTTTCEALWMGVPVVTRAGTCHAARVGVSLLSSLGLADLVATSQEEYVDKAVQLAHDRQRREHLREHLRLLIAQSPLMDAPGLTRDVENAYRGMIRAGSSRTVE